MLVKVWFRIVLFPQVLPCWHGVGAQSRDPKKILICLEVDTNSLVMVTLHPMPSLSLTPILFPEPVRTERNRNQAVDLDLEARQAFNSMLPEICHWNQNFMARIRVILLNLKVTNLHVLGTKSLGWHPYLGSPLPTLLLSWDFLLSLKVYDTCISRERKG